MNTAHPSRLDGTDTAQEKSFAAGTTFETVDWNLWQVCASFDAQRLDALADEIIRQNFAGQFGYAFGAGLFSSRNSKENYRFLSTLCQLPLRRMFPTLPQSGELRLQDVLRCWPSSFGTIVEEGTEEFWIESTAIWRDRHGVFHLLEEEELHWGKRLIRTMGQAGVYEGPFAGAPQGWHAFPYIGRIVIDWTYRQVDDRCKIPRIYRLPIGHRFPQPYVDYNPADYEERPSSDDD